VYTIFDIVYTMIDIVYTTGPAQADTEWNIDIRFRWNGLNLGMEDYTDFYPNVNVSLFIAAWAYLTIYVCMLSDLD
jgi:hypothetical protein